MTDFVSEMQYCDDVHGVIRSARVIHHDYLDTYEVIVSSCEQHSLRTFENRHEFHAERKAIVCALQFVYSHLYNIEHHDD